MLDAPSHHPIKMPTVSPGKPNISMAPLIDIVFLLLIFFVVTTVFPDEQAITIEKPQVQNSERMINDPFVISIDSKNQYFFQQRPVTDKDLVRLLTQQQLSHPGVQVLIKADRHASTQALLTAMDACKTVGIHQISVATTPGDETNQ